CSCVSLNSYGPHSDLHSFPTRRSSDLLVANSETLNSPSTVTAGGDSTVSIPDAVASVQAACASMPSTCGVNALSTKVAALYPTRSEEHTSELQSLAYLVCRLLLEKKK